MFHFWILNFEPIKKSDAVCCKITCLECLTWERRQSTNNQLVQRSSSIYLIQRQTNYFLIFLGCGKLPRLYFFFVHPSKSFSFFFLVFSCYLLIWYSDRLIFEQLVQAWRAIFSWKYPPLGLQYCIAEWHSRDPWSFTAGRIQQIIRFRCASHQLYRVKRPMTSHKYYIIKFQRGKNVSLSKFLFLYFVSIFLFVFVFYQVGTARSLSAYTQTT
jgi:hypothetical protein